MGGYAMIYCFILFLVQEASPEKEFQAVRKVIEESKAFQVTLRVTSTVGEGKAAKTFDSTGMISWKAKNKVNLSLKGKDPRQVKRTISNGAQVKNDVGFGWTEANPAPKTLQTSIATAFALAGTAGINRLFLEWSFDRIEHDGEALKKLFHISDIRQGEETNDERSLTYKLKITGVPSPMEVQLWYDAKSYKPKKRVFKLEVEKTVMTEVYESVAVDAPVSDDTFELP